MIFKKILQLAIRWVILETDLKKIKQMTWLG